VRENECPDFFKREREREGERDKDQSIDGRRSIYAIFILKTKNCMIGKKELGFNSKGRLGVWGIWASTAGSGGRNLRPKVVRIVSARKYLVQFGFFVSPPVPASRPSDSDQISLWHFVLAATARIFPASRLTR
jgi:hypothetical protein